MPKRLNLREQLALRIEALTDAEVARVLEYIALSEHIGRPATNPAGWDDELVAVLSEAKENRRARQAFAWEAVRRQSERRATLSGPRSS